MMLNTGSATAQFSITQSNLQAVQTCDTEKDYREKEELRKKEELQEIGELFELFKEVYKEFKKDRKGETLTDRIKKAKAKFENYKNHSRTRTISNEPRNICSSTLKVTSEGLSKFQQFLSETASAVSDMVKFKELKDFTRATITIIGSAHLIGAALLVVVVLFERWETISKSKEECLGLLEKMTDLVSYLYQISPLSTEFSQMGDLRFQEIIRECLDTLMDGYGWIWFTLTAAKKWRFLNAKTEKEELAKLKDELGNKYSKLVGQILINLSISAPHPRPHDFTFPSKAVGLMDEMRTTIDQMKWEDDEKALAVVLHGYKGSGKTTLGDAVCYSQYVNKPPGFSDGRCAVVRLFRGMNSLQIIKAQSILINDLQNSNFKPKSANEGRNKIGKIIRNIPAFIYIDNVEGDEELKEVLPCDDLNEAKKLRLLLTCRDYRHCLTLKLSRPIVSHRIKPLSEEAATKIINEHLREKAWLNDTIRKEIADMCWGIPKLLNDTASYLFNTGKDGLEIVKEQYENCSDKFVKKLDSMLGLEELEVEERDALLDILCFFKQENWDEVKRIVRGDILSELAYRSLVEKTHQKAIKFDDVLSYTTEKEARETRFTTEQQINKFLKAKGHPRRRRSKDMKNIKGISVPSTMDKVDIPSILLDHMQGSVRVLKLGMKGKIEGECKESFEKLIYLDCRPFIHLKTPKLRCLRLLSDIPDIEVDLRTFWLEKFKDLQELREIQISGSSLKALPNDLDLLKKLEVLKLICCHDLEDLGSGFSHLSREIKLFLCDYLKSRMESIIPGLNYVNISCHVNASIQQMH